MLTEWLPGLAAGTHETCVDAIHGAGATDVVSAYEGPEECQTIPR